MIRSFFTAFLVILSTCTIFAQAPNISYQTPQTYRVGITVNPLIPANTGSSVPATIYGQVTTFAGSGATGSIDATGTAATFNNPYNSFVDASGNLFVADTYNQLIRKITPAAAVTTVAGNGSAGNVNGTAGGANFNNPGGITTDATGNLFVGDQNNNMIRKITPAGVVTTYAGTGVTGMSNGTIINASFNGPAGVAFSALGNLYVADRNNNSIRMISLAGTVITFAGTGAQGFANGAGALATFNNPCGLAFDNVGNLFVADQDNNVIRKITSLGVVSTYAGTGVPGVTNGPAATATFTRPFGIAIDPIGNIYVADQFSHIVRKISAAGIVSTLAGSGSISSIDGIGTAASFGYPCGVTYESSGIVYVTDNFANKIRKVIVTGYTIDKPLPAGLSFDARTGIITGTPTAASPATVYTVTAYNTGGSSTTTLSITVTSLLPQTITFPPMPNKVYGDPDFNPGGVVSSALGISYTSSNPAIATITSSGNIHITGVGTVIITANQPGDATFGAAVAVAQSLTVTQAPLTVKATDQTRVYGVANPALTVSYTGFVYGETAAVLTTLPTVSTTAVITSNVGTYPVTASGAVAANYNISYLAGTLTVTKAVRTLVFNPLAAKTYGDSDFDPGATISSGETITYTSSNTALVTIVNGKIHILGAGTVTITASVAANANYNDVTPISQQLVVNKAMQTINFAAIPNQNKGGPDITLSAVASSGLAVTVTSSNPAVAPVSGFTVKLLNIGTVTFTAFQPGDNNYLPATATQTLTIGEFLPDLVRVTPLVTPNGDGINDVFVIEGINKYPDNHLVLVNKNGVKIFETNGYNNGSNNFNGYSNITGVPQPQGTYFYSLEFKADGQNNKRVGFIVLKY